MRPSSLNPHSPRPISTEPAWLLWSEAETSDQDLSSTIHQLNIISFPPQSSDGYTYAHIIGLQTLERALAQGGSNESRGASGGAVMLWGLQFSNIIKTYLFCVPHKEHPRPLTEVGRSTLSQAHPALHDLDYVWPAEVKCGFGLIQVDSFLRSVGIAVCWDQSQGLKLKGQLDNPPDMKHKTFSQPFSSLLIVSFLIFLVHISFETYNKYNFMWNKQYGCQ